MRNVKPVDGALNIGWQIELPEGWQGTLPEVDG